MSLWLCKEDGALWDRESWKAPPTHFTWSWCVVDKCEGCILEWKQESYSQNLANGWLRTPLSEDSWVRTPEWGLLSEDSLVRWKLQFCGRKFFCYQRASNLTSDFGERVEGSSSFPPGRRKVSLVDKSLKSSHVHLRALLQILVKVKVILIACISCSSTNSSESDSYFIQSDRVLDSFMCWTGISFSGLNMNFR